MAVPNTSSSLPLEAPLLWSEPHSDHVHPSTRVSTPGWNPYIVQARGVRNRAINTQITFLPVFFPQVHLLADGKAQQLDTTIIKY